MVQEQAASREMLIMAPMTPEEFRKGLDQCEDPRGSDLGVLYDALLTRELKSTPGKEAELVVMDQVRKAWLEKLSEAERRELAEIYDRVQANILINTAFNYPFRESTSYHDYLRAGCPFWKVEDVLKKIYSEELAKIVADYIKAHGGVGYWIVKIVSNKGDRGYTPYIMRLTENEFETFKKRFKNPLSR